MSYEVLRRLVDFELGTMQLDSRGVWIDPGEYRASEIQPTDSPDNPEQPDDASLQRVVPVRTATRNSTPSAGWKATTSN